MTLEAKDSTQDIPLASEILSSLNELKAEMKELRLEIQDRKEEAATEKSILARLSELEKEVKNLKLENEKLKSSGKPTKKAVEPKRDEVVLDWDLEGAKSFLNGTRKGQCQSPIFYAAGVSWDCYCVLNEEEGKNGKKGKKFVGFYLRSQNIDEELGTWSVSSTYELRLFSPSGKLIKCSRYSNEFKRPTAFGEHHFFSCDELKKSGLIVKDRIKLQVYLSAIKHQ